MKFLKLKLSNMLYFLLSVVFLSSCNENNLFTGYLVAKEYTPEHMSNESVKTINYAAVAPIIASTPPTKVDAEWRWYIANKYEVIAIRVTKEYFNTKNCGQKVTVYRY